MFSRHRSDSELVQRAARQDGEAWSALVDRYDRYVLAVIRSTRIRESDEADVFQHVFIELYKALPTLRQADRLAGWLRQTALRQAIRMRQRTQKGPTGLDDLATEPSEESFSPEIEKAERDLAVREAVETLQAKCKELIRRLFFTDPPEPYAAVAESLGIKTSSLNVTRQRCLDALEKALAARGFT